MFEALGRGTLMWRSHGTTRHLVSGKWKTMNPSFIILKRSPSLIDTHCAFLLTNTIHIGVKKKN